MPENEREEAEPLRLFFVRLGVRRDLDLQALKVVANARHALLGSAGLLDQAGDFLSQFPRAVLKL
jgi:hypothetical protein